MISSQGTKSSKPAAFQAAGETWRPVAGFTWELFFNVPTWVIYFAMIPVIFRPTNTIGDICILNSSRWCAAPRTIR